MIKLHNLSLSFGEQPIFSGISAMLQSDDKVGLVGPNGAGKSTLLKVIAGRQKLNGGRVTLSNGLRFAYLPQEVVLESQHSIFEEALLAYGEVGTWYLREKELAANGEQECAEYAQLHADLADHDFGSKAAQARRVLIGLGLEQSRHDEPVRNLSVGWQMRVVLTKLLLQEADIYLFDEPTNHLDLPAREWLCSFLRQASFGYILISHDRYVLDAVCDKTIVLNQGRLREYNGNYSFYRRIYEETIELQRAAKAAQDKEIAQKQRTIERFRASANKAKMAQSMMKQLERIERIELDEEAMPNVALPFPPVSRIGRTAIKVSNLAKSFDTKNVFFDASFEIERGQRVAIVAPNGAGKTTLLSCIYNALQPDRGTVELGHNVKVAVFEQEQVTALDKNATVLEEVERASCAYLRPQIRSVLGALLFSGDAVKKKIKVLSGGERNRVALAKVLVQEANVLLLDEPTNHLDLISKQVLAEALGRYQGTLVFVSHDRDIVEKVANTIISIDHAAVTMYPGNYESFRFAREQQVRDEPRAVVSEKKPQKKNNGELRELRKQLARLERDIAKCEQKEQKALDTMGQYEYGTDEYARALKSYEAAQEQHSTLQTEWESLYERLES